MFLIDAAVPSDIDPGVEAVSGAFVYSLDDLEEVAREGVAAREATMRTAWDILGEETARFLRQRAERSAVPAVTALREHFESVREEILANGKLDAEAATRLLVKRLLHGPSEALREAAGSKSGEQQEMERAAARLFGLGASRRDEDEESKG